MASAKPRKQRKRAANAPWHRLHKRLAAHVDPRLREKGKLAIPRAVPVRKGDIVRIVRGGFRGREGKVVSVDVRNSLVTVEKVVIRKTDEKEVARPIHASNLVIMKLDDTDPRRLERYRKE